MIIDSASDKNPGAMSNTCFSLAPRISIPPVWMWFIVAIGTAAPFFAVGGFGFVHWDDPQTLTENAFVSGGLSFAGIRYALTSAELNLWHPLTWLSHQLDATLFGLHPAGHHLMNLAIHVLAALALFGALHALTGSRWGSLAVALLFGVHPMHVESVAWISERKDTLSALFAHLTLWVYAIHGGRASNRSRVWYGIALGFFTLGLLAKPSLVVWPAVLILCDFWPLHRMDDGRAFLKCVKEKIPFLVLAALVTGVTLWLQHGRADAAVAASMPPLQRLMSGVANYGTYVLRLFWPSGLCYFYPARQELPWRELFIGCGVLAAGLTTAFAVRNRTPWITWGALFFLGVLAPVAGFVVSGESVAPDRYSYLSATGLFLALVWTGRWLAGRLPGGVRIVVPVSLGMWMAALGFLSWQQAGCWKDTRALALRALDVTENNYHAHVLLGVTLIEDEPAKARAQFERALSIREDHRYAHYNIGRTWEVEGDPDRAREAYLAQLETWPESDQSLNALGNLEMARKRYGEAILFFERLRETGKNQIAAWNGWASAHGLLGDWEKAVEGYEALVKLRPNNGTDHANLGLAYLRQGKKQKAVTAFRRALKLNPQDKNARIGLREAERSANR